MLKVFQVCLFLFLFSSAGYGQITNIDPNQSYINVNTPRTPESAAFEKYGNTEVNEFTGASNISIPIYNLKSRFLESPITLSYQATGIKVNQEASWVGLGWDLIAGGRITVETKGSVDFCAATRGLFSTTNLSLGMQKLFNRLANNREVSVLTYASVCDAGLQCNTDPAPDNLQAVQDMTEFGAGEPDIFRANFLGHSLTFYVDKITGNLNFIGEQSLFSINYILDAYNNITGWTITDNVGISYYFNQVETSTNTLPGSAVIPATSTSAWLLTKVVHPSGDYIQYTYNNFGYSVPAFTMYGSIDWYTNTNTVNLSNDYNQNITVQSPFYLTRIESVDAAVDFIVDTRSDLYGPGSRKLTQIKVTDKFTGVVKKMATFNYTYFQSGTNPSSTYLNSLFYNLPAPLTASAYLACSNTRLRLDSVNINYNNYQPPYKFYYNVIAVDKYSYGQDHWGYFNGVANQTNGYSFTHLIPFSGLGGVQNIIPANLLNTSIIGYSRECDPTLVQAMMMTSVVYPAGGSAMFSYAPHQSKMILQNTITGGGVRINSVSSFLGGNLTGRTNYTYYGGKYMGSVEYYNGTTTLACNGIVGQMKYSSNGAANYNDILIGYAMVSSTEQSPTGASNGSLLKMFNIVTPSSSYSNGTGFDVLPAHWPAIHPINPQTATDWLNASYSGFPPTPASNLEGKLMQEQYFDSLNNLLKSVSYYYHLANYTNNFYDVKAIQNRINGFDGSGCSGTWNTGTDDGVRPSSSLFLLPNHFILYRTV